MHQLLRKVANMVLFFHPSSFVSLRVILTFLRQVVDIQDGRAGVCALEGAPHSDSMDYIVSALVVNRENLQPDSGESSVYTLEGQQLLKTILKPGEGIFQDDKNSLHHITDIQQADPLRRGVRDMLGIDFVVL